MTKGKPDLDVVRRNLMALDEALQTLRKQRGLSIEELKRNREALWIVERGLQLCAQNALDIATHLSASSGHDVTDYAAGLDHLAEMGVLPADFAARFRGVAGFRNVVVHGYLEFDLALVHRLLNERLEDFAEFARFVSHYVQARSGE